MTVEGMQKFSSVYGTSGAHKRHNVKVQLILQHLFEDAVGRHDLKTSHGPVTGHKSEEISACPTASLHKEVVTALRVALSCGILEAQARFSKALQGVEMQRSGHLDKNQLIKSSADDENAHHSHKPLPPISRPITQHDDSETHALSRNVDIYTLHFSQAPTTSDLFWDIDLVWKSVVYIGMLRQIITEDVPLEVSSEHVEAVVLIPSPSTCELPWGMRCVPELHPPKTVILQLTGVNIFPQGEFPQGGKASLSQIIESAGLEKTSEIIKSNP
ncbi:hypothetical protein WISP_24317 [Willisornis vidua]|uniref:Uncharacterized protein n=1 Tax=Willisornis vidua TaxID=1566151 RepID=A0ABQ9DM76_9PASS|nr:hypothetical protein WISP_24317 [Willisornis vidua]